MTTTPASGPRPFTVPTAKHRTRFFDYRIPSLYAGRYEIHDRQILKDVDGGDRVIDATPQPFDVIEPRFSIDPAGINARFPAPDAIGTYSQILPHINLDAPGLPWNRPLGPEYPKPVPPEPGDPHPEPPKAVPWMALLLFREDELPEDPDAVGSVTAGTVRELLCSRLGPGVHPPCPRRACGRRSTRSVVRRSWSPPTCSTRSSPCPWRWATSPTSARAVGPMPRWPGPTRRRTRSSSTAS
ncbi:hypothetical protein Srufu_014920 [Streptomyces libani subsp. rufus]|nr:hypothetical protein Srufu_014920 [Streptomyces libani subsp. rufus]